MTRQLRIAADGFMDLSDRRRVKTPGARDAGVDAMPVGEAISFLLSHSFPGHRRIVRPLSESDRKNIRLALWADSVQVRMTYVDRVWRNITDPVPPPTDMSRPELVQVIQYGVWAYPLYLDGHVTRVIPHGGMPMPEIQGGQRLDYADLHEQLQSA